MCLFGARIEFPPENANGPEQLKQNDTLNIIACPDRIDFKEPARFTRNAPIYQQGIDLILYSSGKTILRVRYSRSQYEDKLYETMPYIVRRSLERETIPIQLQEPVLPEAVLQMSLLLNSSFSHNGSRYVVTDIPDFPFDEDSRIYATNLITGEEQSFTDFSYVCEQIDINNMM